MEALATAATGKLSRADTTTPHVFRMCSRRRTAVAPLPKGTSRLKILETYFPAAPPSKVSFSLESDDATIMNLPKVPFRTHRARYFPLIQHIEYSIPDIDLSTEADILLFVCLILLERGGGTGYETVTAWDTTWS